MEDIRTINVCYCDPINVWNRLNGSINLLALPLLAERNKTLRLKNVCTGSSLDNIDKIQDLVRYTRK